MNEPQETQVSIRLVYVILFWVLATGISSTISYRLGKGQAYREILQACLHNRIYAGLCFLASEDEAISALESLSNEKR